MQMPLALGGAAQLVLVRGANVAPPEIGEGDLGVGLDLGDVGREAFPLVAGTGLTAVEPLHAATLIPPDAQGLKSSRLASLLTY